MINPHWLELAMSRIKLHGPKDVRAIMFYHDHNYVTVT